LLHQLRPKRLFRVRIHRLRRRNDERSATPFRLYGACHSFVPHTHPHAIIWRHKLVTIEYLVPSDNITNVDRHINFTKNLARWQALIRFIDKSVVNYFGGHRLPIWGVVVRIRNLRKVKRKSLGRRDWVCRRSLRFFSCFGRVVRVAGVSREPHHYHLLVRVRPISAGILR